MLLQKLVKISILINQHNKKVKLNFEHLQKQKQTAKDNRNKEKTQTEKRNKTLNCHSDFFEKCVHFYSSLYSLKNNVVFVELRIKFYKI